MLVMSLAPALSTIGLLGGALVVCLVGLILVADRRQRNTPVDTEQAYSDLTQRLRHPWMYRAEAVRRWIQRDLTS